MRNMSYVVTVEKCDEIPGKDRIQYIHFKENGYGVIASKDIKAGDELVYFEVDSIIPMKPCFEFLRARCYKPELNGLYSNGLVMTFDECGLKNYKPGKDLTNVLSIRKYEPEDDASPVENKMPAWKKSVKNFLMKHHATKWLGKMLFIKKSVAGSFPVDIIPKSDEENIQNNKYFFNKYKDDPCYISYKMEGQSTSFIVKKVNKKYVFSYYGRSAAGTGAQYEFIKEHDIEKKMLDYAKKNNVESFAVQGEFCAPSVQKGIYKNGVHQYVYKINIDGNTVDLTKMLRICSELGFETVPIMCIESSGFGKMFKSLNEMQEKTEHIWFKLSDIGTLVFADDRDVTGIPKKKDGVWHRNEGLVIRNVDESWSFKVKSNEYAIEGL